MHRNRAAFHCKRLIAIATDRCEMTHAMSLNEFVFSYLDFLPGFYV